MLSIKPRVIGRAALVCLVWVTWLSAPAPAFSAPTPHQDSVRGTVTTLGFVNQVIHWQITATSGPREKT